MATFEAQVEALTGISIDGSSNPTQTELSSFLQDGVKDVIHRMIEVRPAELPRFCSTTDSGAGAFVAKVGKILSVTREHDSTSILRKCTQIDPGDRYDATDTDSLNYRSKTNPGYYELNGKIHTVPVAAESGDNNVVVTQLFYDTGVAYGDEVPDNFPESYAYLVAIYASIQSLKAKMSNSIISIVAVPPDVPTITASTVSFSTTPPLYTTPTTTISGTIWATAYPDEYTALNTALAAIAAEIGECYTLADDMDEQVESAESAYDQFRGTSDPALFGDETQYLTGVGMTHVKDALDNAKTIIDDGVNSPTGNAAGDAATYLYTDEDIELMNGTIAIASSEINRANAHIAEWNAMVQSLNAEAQGFLATSQGFGAEIQSKLAIAGAHASEVQALLSQTPMKVSEYQARVQDELNEFNKLNAQYQADLQVSIQNAQLEDAEEAKKIQKYSAELSVYQAEVNTEVQEKGTKVQQYKALHDQLLLDYNSAFVAPGAAE